MLDLSAAFDSADRSILLQSLEHVIGIAGTALGWVSSHSSDRFLLVFVHDVSLRHTNVSHGVSCFPSGNALFGRIIKFSPSSNGIKLR